VIDMLWSGVIVGGVDGGGWAGGEVDGVFVGLDDFGCDLLGGEEGSFA